MLAAGFETKYTFVPPLELLPDLIGLRTKAQRVTDAPEIVADALESMAVDIRSGAIDPVFEARSQDQYWAVRDRLVGLGLHWPEILRKFVLLAEPITGEVALDPKTLAPAIERLKRAPPALLSDAAREDLIEGARNHQRLLADIIRSRPKVGAIRNPLSQALAKVPANRAERIARILASYMLLSLWAGELMRGHLPKDPRVVDSIAKNYANVVAGFRVYVTNLQPARPKK